MWKRELEIAKEAAIEAGKRIMLIYNNISSTIDITYKDGDMPVTVADREANRVIVTKLKTGFPDYAVLSEEEKDDCTRLKKDFCFIVDPLDGTKEFIKRNGQFTVNISLAHNGKSVVGVIYVPVAEELYYASQGDGAFLKRKDGSIVKLHVSDITDISKIRVVMSSSHKCREMEELIKKHGFKNIVSMGSSLKGCIVAEGKAEIYYRYNPTMEWDTAAMQCIVEESGGIFRQMDDSEMFYNRENSINDKGFYIINDVKNRYF